MPAARPGKQQGPVIADNNCIGTCVAHSLKTAMVAICAREEIVEGVREFARERTFDAQPKIAPAACDSITAVFGANVESADERDFLIDDENLSVIAMNETLDVQWIEPAKLAAGGDQIVPVARQQLD